MNETKGTAQAVIELLLKMSSSERWRVLSAIREAVCLRCGAPGREGDCYCHKDAEARLE